ncbi:MAG: TolC family protein [Singulisphaera sp.]
MSLDPKEGATAMRSRARLTGNLALARVYRPFGWALLCLICCGCGRPLYRAWADREVYGIEGERMFDWRWNMPGRPVEADPRSRMRDPFDPDREPIPPDEPAARRFQVSAGRHFEYHGWRKWGAAPIEDLSWLKYLPREPDGSVKIARDSVMQLAVVNSREYQVEVEDVYLAALSLTLSRFEFAVQFFGSQRTFFDHFGTGENETNQLQLGGRGGLNKRFMSGAQLLVDFANTLVFEFSGTGAGTNLSSSSLLVSLTQPLLRGAFARIVTQPLSLQERGTLYAIRDFARFRRGFYVDIVAGDGFLGLLTQLQTIRNTESNLRSLRRNLDEYQGLADAGLISLLERDQISQEYQSTQLNLVQAQASLQSSLDNYKIRLGFPPDLELSLDDSILNIFELNDPRLDALRTRNEALYLSLLQFEDPPSAEFLAEAGRRLRAELVELEPIAAGVADELQGGGRTRRDDGRTPGGTASPDRSETLDRQRTLSKGWAPSSPIAR